MKKEGLKALKELLEIIKRMYNNEKIAFVDTHVAYFIDKNKHIDIIKNKKIIEQELNNYYKFVDEYNKKVVPILMKTACKTIRSSKAVTIILDPIIVKKEKKNDTKRRNR